MQQLRRAEDSETNSEKIMRHPGGSFVCLFGVA